MRKVEIGFQLFLKGEYLFLQSKYSIRVYGSALASYVIMKKFLHLQIHSISAITKIVSIHSETHSHMHAYVAV